MASRELYLFFVPPKSLFFLCVLSIASNKAVTERRWASQLYSIISITVSLHNPFQLTASRMFLQFSPLQTGLKKETSQRSKLKIQRGKQNKIWGIQNTLFLFQLPNHKFTPISKWKPLLRSNCSLSICVRAKIKPTAALRPKWNAVQSVWLVTRQRAGSHRLRRSRPRVRFCGAGKKKGRSGKLVGRQTFSFIIK